MIDPVQEWAKHKAELHRLHQEVAENYYKNNISKSALAELGQQAQDILEQSGLDKFETEHGTVQIVPEGKINFHPVSPNFKPRHQLTFISKKEK